MRIIFDYRSALRERTGVGEYVHQLAMNWRREFPEDDVTLFTSSWKDRPSPDVASSAMVVSDHRIPVRVLNFLWHNAGWPPVEWLTRQRYDVAFSPSPLLLPARAAAQVVMVHDLDFLDHPERTQREIRSDYPRLASTHARRARQVIVPSSYTAGQVESRLGVTPSRIAVCPPGLPSWETKVSGVGRTGYALFVGTLEPRKNVGALLSAYARLATAGVSLPRLVLAGRLGEGASPWLEAIGRPPLAGLVEHIGYVSDEQRQELYAGARVFVLPSFEEGFGMTALEAMSQGVPVIASARGALPELVGDAGILIDPDDHASIARALSSVLASNDLAETLASRGVSRSTAFSWAHTVVKVREVFESAIASRTSERGAPYKVAPLDDAAVTAPAAPSANATRVDDI